MLVVVVSAKRHGELVSLFACEPYLKILPDSAFFRTVPFFLPEVLLDSKLNQEIYLPFLLCAIYLHISRDFRLSGRLKSGG